MEAFLKVYQPGFQFGLQSLPPVCELFSQTIIQEVLPFLVSLNPLTGFIEGKAACPGSEGLTGIVVRKFFPEGQSRLLNDVVGICEVGNKRRHITEDLPFTPEKKTQKKLLVRIGPAVLLR